MTRHIIPSIAALMFAGTAAAGGLTADVGADVDVGLSGQTDTEFSELDANADGMISATEAKADNTASMRFSEADENHDEMLTKAEFSAIAKTSAEEETGE